MIIIGARAEDMTWRDVYFKENIPYCDIMTNYTQTMKTTRTVILARQKEQGHFSQAAASSSSRFSELRYEKNSRNILLTQFICTCATSVCSTSFKECSG